MQRKIFQISLVGFLFLLVCLHTGAQTLRILPLGNSLTKGVYCNNGTIVNCENRPDSEIVGYRYALYNSLLGSGYTFEYVGNEIAGWTVFPTTNLSRHAGYPGITSTLLASKLSESNYYLLTSTAPDIVLLEIGTNDIAQGLTSIEGVRTILNNIDHYESTSGKPVLVFLSKVIRFTQGTTNEGLVSTFNNNLINLFNQRVSSGDKILWLDMGINLVNLKEPAGDMKDELHPNQSGYNKVAAQWFQAINSYNTAPVATQIPNQSINEGATFSTLSLDNYIYDAEDSDAQITWTVETNPQNFDVLINGSRQAVVSVKNNDWNGSENITLTATDRGKTVPGLKKSVSITFTCTVNPVNDPPVIMSQTRIPSTVEETALAVALSDMQVQDVDNPAGDLTVQILSGTNYTYNGNLVTPAVDFNGELTVNLRVNDPQSSSSSFAFKISVTAKNDIPVINSASSVQFDEDSYCVLKLNQYQINDPDNFYPADYVLLLGTGMHYTLRGDTIVPEENFNGELQVPLRVRDLLDQSAEFIHHITVNPVNDPPSVIIPENRTIYEGDYLEIQLEASDVDQSDVLQISPVAIPAWLSLNQSNHKLIGTPQHQNIGENQVKIRVTDTHLSVDSTFTIEVKLKSGIPGFEEQLPFVVSPNPAAAYIKIKSNTKTFGQAVFRLISVSGITVLTVALGAEDTVIYLDQYALPRGIYFYEISGKYSEPFQGKLVISSGSDL
jgi:lysophospholipase L1-like esterase